ncbi:MAG: hypothetical protein IT210_11835 [Armatimonadetes bacterium]|nr:hypothetical protein [Armatimonadota bacterium]
MPLIGSLLQHGFNANKAAKAFLERPVAYGLQDDRIGESWIWALPSTSGAANGFWMHRIGSIWQRLKEIVVVMSASSLLALRMTEDRGNRTWLIQSMWQFSGKGCLYGINGEQRIQPSSPT